MNIETLTLGSIAALTTTIIVLIGNILKIYKGYEKSVQKIVKEEIKPLSDKIDALSKKVDNVDMDSTKNFLVTTIGEVERNGWTDETTRQRFYESFQRYEKMGGNSYIHTRFDELHKQNKI